MKARSIVFGKWALLSQVNLYIVITLKPYPHVKFYFFSTTFCGNMLIAYCDAILMSLR